MREHPRAGSAQAGRTVFASLTAFGATSSPEESTTGKRDVTVGYKKQINVECRRIEIVRSKYMAGIIDVEQLERLIEYIIASPAITEHYVEQINRLEKEQAYFVETQREETT